MFDITAQTSDHGLMRTTLDIDDPILLALKSLARARGTSMGKLASELLAKALAPTDAPAPTRNGLPLLEPVEAVPVTLDLVNELRDDG